MKRWQRYWFADGGRTSLAIVRIAVATAVLLSLARLWTLPELVAPAGIYRPVGVWMVLGRTVPPGALIAVLWVVAWAGTAAMLVGAWSRAATAASFGAAVALAAVSFSNSATWSHQYNVVFLAQLALLGGRCGDTLSVDAWLRRRRGLPALDVPGGYQWSVRLVQLAIGLMFVGAAFHKLAHGQFTLRWALSDNLRHHLLVRYDLAGLDRPWLVDWLIDDVWRYRTAACLNFVSQLAPLAAIVFVRRPLVRLGGGAFFVIETIALGLVISLWNLHWLPLAAAFVDWEWLLRRPPPPAREVPLPRRGIRGFVIGFVVYDVITAFVPAVDQRLNTFPFSGFPMFATIRAAEPYDEHRPYAVAGDHFEVIADRPLDARGQRWLDHTNRNLHTLRDPEAIRVRLVATLGRLRGRYPDLQIRALRHWVTLFVAPAYPAPAHFEMHPIAITGELAADGTFRSVIGVLGKDHVALRPRGVDAAGAVLVQFVDDLPAEVPLAATRDGDVFQFTALAGDPVYVVAKIAGTPWLVGSRRSWRWQ